MLDCELQEVLPGGDHAIVLGRVLATQAGDERAPLLIFRRRLGGPHAV